MINRSYLLMALVVFLLNTSFMQAEEIDLSNLSKDKKPIKVFVKNFVNESGQGEIRPEDFKKNFEDAMLRRRAVKFEIAKSADESDLAISGIIKKYQYLERDPITTYVSPTGFALDALTTENYVTMEVEFTVLDTKTAKILWRDKVSTFIKRKMTQEESIPLIYDKVSRNFLWKCFGKPK